MKTAKFSLTVVILALAVFAGYSQKGIEDGSKYGHGEDSIQCIRNYSLYSEYYKQKNYEDAMPYWRLVFHDCPKVSKNVYQHGANMYKFYIIQATRKNDVGLKNALVDTLLQVYDQRIKLYPKDKGKVLGYKAADILRFMQNDLVCMKKAYAFSNEAIDIRKSSTPKSVINTYMHTTLVLFDNNDLTDSDVVENYAKTMAILDAQLAKKPDDEELENLKASVSSNFANSGAASCEALIKLFTPQFKESPGDVDVLKKISYWLNNTGCTESNLYLDATISLNKIEPSAALAYHIAQLYVKQKNYQAAVQFYKQAIDQETETAAKSKYLVEIGYIIQSEYGDLPQAKSYALKAIKADPSSGKPYLLLGNIYAGAKNYGPDDLSKKAVFWVSVDQYIKAKQLNPDLASIANDRIKAYSQYFPDTEMVFFFGFNVGDSYTLDGWINESTIVRTK